MKPKGESIFNMLVRSIPSKQFKEKEGKHHKYKSKFNLIKYIDVEIK